VLKLALRSLLGAGTAFWPSRLHRFRTAVELRATRTLVSRFADTAQCSSHKVI